MNSNAKIKKQNLIFLLTLVVFAVLCFLKDFGSAMSHYNSTLYSFSYKYGFISRGFVGSCYHALNKIVPIDLMTYQSLYVFSIAMTIVLLLTIFLFYYYCLNKCSEENLHNIRMLIVFFSVFTFSNFWTAENLGRIDIYFIILLLISVILVVEDKLAWLVIPLIGICMCVHQGFTFTNANLILALLFFRAMTSKKNNTRKKYLIFFIITFAEISVLFLYFELFSHMSDTGVVNELISTSMNLSKSGHDYNETILNHEILGQGVFEDEIGYHIINLRELPFFLITFCPYIIIFIIFAKRLLKGEKGTQLLGYLAVVLGGLTLLPEMILKVDFGRYAYYTFFYYILIVICLIVMGDNKTIDAFNSVKQSVNKKISFGKLLIVYPLIFMPFSDWFISDITLRLCDIFLPGWLFK